MPISLKKKIIPEQFGEKLQALMELFLLPLIFFLEKQLFLILSNFALKFKHF